MIARKTKLKLLDILVSRVMEYFHFLLYAKRVVLKRDGPVLHKS